MRGAHLWEFRGSFVGVWAGGRCKCVSDGDYEVYVHQDIGWESSSVSVKGADGMRRGSPGSLGWVGVGVGDRGRSDGVDAYVSLRVLHSSDARQPSHGTLRVRAAECGKWLSGVDIGVERVV